MEASFGLSINSEHDRPGPPLLSLLGVLPDGIAHDDLDTLQPGHGEEAAASLRKMGLAFDEASGLRMLQPIRDHVQAAHAPRPDDLARAAAYYHRARHDARLAAGIPRAAPRPAADYSPSAATWRRCSPMACRRTTPGQRSTPRSPTPSSYDSPDLGTEAPLLEAAASAASRLGDATLQADALFRLGIVIHDRSDLDTAQARFEEAQPLYEQVGDILGQANCIRALGDIALDRSDLDTAQARYQQALTLYQRIPEPHNIGLTHQGLARMAESQAERHQHIQAARTAWTSIGRP